MNHATAAQAIPFFNSLLVGSTALAAKLDLEDMGQIQQNTTIASLLGNLR